MLDHVHGGHGETGTVDNAADVSVEADVAEASIGGIHFTRIFLRLVAQLGDLRTPEQRVIVKAHLGVEREDSTIRSDHQRVDFDHGRIEIAEGTVTGLQRLHGFGQLAGTHAQGKGDFTRLEILHTHGGFNRHANDGIGLRFGDFLNVHTARS